MATSEQEGTAILDLVAGKRSPVQGEVWYKIRPYKNNEFSFTGFSKWTESSAKYIKK